MKIAIMNRYLGFVHSKRILSTTGHSMVPYQKRNLSGLKEIEKYGIVPYY